jgi:hypothetical protein
MKVEFPNSFCRNWLSNQPGFVSSLFQALPQDRGSRYGKQASRALVFESPMGAVKERPEIFTLLQIRAVLMMR